MKLISHLLTVLALTQPAMSMGTDPIEEPEEIEYESLCEERNSTIFIGANYTRLNFKPEDLSSFDGNLGGLHAKYEYQPANAIYAGAAASWRQGSIDGSDGKRDLLDLNVSERLGYTWGCDSWLATAYTGIGFQFLGHHFKPSSQAPATFSGSFFPPFLTSEASLKLDYYEFYVPVGLTAKYEFSQRFSLGLSFEWMPQACAIVNIRPLGGAYWSLTNTLANFLVEMPFTFNWTTHSWALVLTPFYERWQDGHSTAKTSNGTALGLPGNTYNFYGVNLDISYSF